MGSIIRISDLKHEIEEIMENMDCPKDFACYKANFENLCKFEELCIEDYVECGSSCNESLTICPSRFDFGGSYLCSCPLRVFVAKRLNR
ncbi:MAG: hypothetical protein R6U44_06160 [Archaeoglobaceae archaeon]